MRVAVAGSTGQVGRRLTARLRQEGHEVVGLSRGEGYDLTDAAGVDALARGLAGSDAVIDVTNVISRDRAEAIAFFTTVAANLSSAAVRAGVRRTVLLSIIGVDGIPHDAHYAAKRQQELVYEDRAPGPRVVRAAQFHEFAEMVLGWGRDGDRVHVQDIPVQPVDLDVVVRALVEAASGASGTALLDVAGPRVERLPELVTRVVQARGEQLAVVPVPASAELTAGACLAGPDALVAGPTFDEWLAHTHRQRTA